MTDPKNAELLASMAAMAEGHDDAKLRRLYRALRESTVVVVSYETSIPLNEATEQFVRTYREEGGREVLVAYATPDVAPSDRPRSFIPFVELCKQVAPGGLAIHINPGMPHGGIAPANWVRAIAEGDTEMPNAGRTFATRVVKYSVSQAPTMKAAVLERLTAVLAASRGIVEAYVGSVTADGHAHPIPTLCVVVKPEIIAEADRLAHDLHAWVRPLMESGDEIDFFIVPPGDTVVAEFRTIAPPFYRTTSN